MYHCIYYFYIVINIYKKKYIYIYIYLNPPKVILSGLQHLYLRQFVHFVSSLSSINCEMPKLTSDASLQHTYIHKQYMSHTWDLPVVYSTHMKAPMTISKFERLWHTHKPKEKKHNQSCSPWQITHSQHHQPYQPGNSVAFRELL